MLVLWFVWWFWLGIWVVPLKFLFPVLVFALICGFSWLVACVSLLVCVWVSVPFCHDRMVFVWFFAVCSPCAPLALSRRVVLPLVVVVSCSLVLALVVGHAFCLVVVLSVPWCLVLAPLFCLGSGVSGCWCCALLRLVWGLAPSLAPRLRSG